MRDFSQLSNAELVLGLDQVLETERKLAEAGLSYLLEMRRRRVYAELGYDSMFWMLVKRFHLSESSANDRLRALELVFVVPSSEEKLATGEVNLSTLAMAQRRIRAEEKETGRKITANEKAAIVAAIAGKNQRQAEQELMKMLPESLHEPRNIERRISPEASRASWTIPDRLMEKIERLKEMCNSRALS